MGILKNYPPVYVTGPKCNPPTRTPLRSGRDVPPIAILRTTRVLARGGYSHTLPIRVCAAQRGRDFGAPDLERGIHFRGIF